MATFRTSYVDLFVVLAYLAGLAGMAVYCARRNTTTEAYFLGARSFPGWAIGLSMVGTAISSVTFLALPAAAFELDWRQFVSHLPVPLAALLAATVFIPLFRAKQRTSAYEYLEQRFGPLVRLYGALSFIVLHVVRLATVMYLVAIPISLAIDLHVLWVIVMGGIVVTAYTFTGGIAAVIWTDVIQSVLLIAGGVLCLGMIVFSIPGGLATIVEVAAEQQKFSLGPLSTDLSTRTFWAVLVLGVVAWLGNYASNQTVVQRYLAAANQREARKATYLAAAINLPVWAIFFFLGTALFVFYEVFPDERVLAAEPDAVVPYFVLTNMPVGLRGLLGAAVLSAAMSSLDSSIHSVSTVVVTDIVKRYFVRDAPDAFYLRLGRMLTVLTGGLMIAGAAWFYYLPKETMFDVALIAASVFGGCLAALFLTGFFSTRVDYLAALAGLAGAGLVHLYFMLDALELLPGMLSLGMHSYWVAAVVNLSFFAVAYPLSWLRTGNVESHKQLDGLTVWTMRPQS